MKFLGPSDYPSKRQFIIPNILKLNFHSFLTIFGKDFTLAYTPSNKVKVNLIDPSALSSCKIKNLQSLENPSSFILVCFFTNLSTSWPWMEGREAFWYGTVRNLGQNSVLFPYRTVPQEKYRTVIPYRTFCRKINRTVPNSVPYRTVLPSLPGDNMCLFDRVGIWDIGLCPRPLHLGKDGSTVRYGTEFGTVR